MARGLDRKLRMGMVGGGRDASIGAVHRSAATMHGTVEFIAGALSSTPERARASARTLLLDEDRSYGTWQKMVDGEQALDADRRIDFVAVVTPNSLHFPIAKAFAESGIHVVCDKPMTTSLAEARELVDVVEETGIVFALTHNYTGYPMVKQARHMVSAGEVGELLKVVVEYPQGWLLRAFENKSPKLTGWRTDPARSGPANCIGDIGSHCENLVHYVTGAAMTEVCADVMSFGGQRLDNDVSMLVRFDNGMSGLLHASQVAAGEANNLALRVYGTKGSLAWRQEDPNHLWVGSRAGALEVMTRGSDYLCDAARRASCLPSGHPEGFIEAFANVYKNATDTIRARVRGARASEAELDFPDVRDGARGLAFIEAALASSASERKWTAVEGVA